MTDKGGTPKTRGGAEGDSYFKWRLLVPCGHQRHQLNALIDFTIGLLHAENVMVADVTENHTWAQAWFFPRIKSNDLIFSFEMAYFLLLDGYVLDADLIYAAWLRQQPVSAPSNNHISYKKLTD